MRLSQGAQWGLMGPVLRPGLAASQVGAECKPKDENEDDCADDAEGANENNVESDQNAGTGFASFRVE